MSAPGQTIGVSVFTDYLIDALGVSRSNLSLAYLFGTLTSALFLFSAGRLYDRLGARAVAGGATFLLGIVLLYLSYIDKINQGLSELFSGLPNIIVPFVLVFIGFFGIRFFGQGVLTMASRNMAMKWFEKRRGLANAFFGLAISLGLSYSPRVFDALIDLSGWREAWRILALVNAVIFLAFILIFYRDNPRECGLEADGPQKIRARKFEPKRKAAENFSLKEARRTYAFWIITLSLTMFTLIGTAFTFHIVDIFTNAGFDRSRAIRIFFPAAVISSVLHLVASYLSDYIKLKYFIIVQLLGLLLLSGGIIFLPAGAPVLLLIMGHGIVIGMVGTTSSISFPNYFGLKHLGAITGFAVSSQVAGSAIGPYLFSLSSDFSGSYTLAAVIGFIICTLLLVGAVFMEQPKRAKSA